MCQTPQFMNVLCFRWESGLLLASLFLIGSLGCSQPAASQEAALLGAARARLLPDSLRPAFAYDLSAPAATYILPEDLVEVSGVSWVGPGQLAMIQDEKGHIYLLDEQQPEVIAEHDFGKKGDYEDIAVVGDTAFVLRSDGVLFEVPGFQSAEEVESQVYRSFLREADDTEGLCLHPEGYLLIVAKNVPLIDGKPTQHLRAIYRCDRPSLQVRTDPWMLIDLYEIKVWLIETPGVDPKLAEGFDPMRTKDFMPSGLAVHPQTGHLYVISSTGKMLLVYDQQQRLLAVRTLPRASFPQPEGICFSPEGKLYLTNEGRKAEGTLLKFLPIQGEE